MDRIYAGKVVPSVGRTNSRESRVVGNLERSCGHVLRQPVGKCKVADLCPQRCLEIAFRARDFVNQIAVAYGFAQVGVGARVSANRDTGVCHLTKFIRRIR